MPKQIHKLERFEGGINDMADPRDIADNELATCQGIVVNEVGKLRTVGALTGRVGNTNNDRETASGIQGGYGLFPFAADFNSGSAAYDSGSTTAATNYIALADAPNESIDLWSSDVNNITAAKIGLIGSNTKAVYYFADGKLRVTSASVDDGGGVDRFGFIEYTQFDDASESDIDVDGWYEHNVALAAPTANNIKTGASGTSATVTHPDGTTTTHYPDIVAEYPSAGDGLNIKKAGEYEGGNWQKGKYQVAISFVYDYTQESLPLINSVAQTFTVDTDNVGISFTLLVRGTYDTRITGARIYARDTASDGSPLRLLANAVFASASPGGGTSTIIGDNPFGVALFPGVKNQWTNTPALGASYIYMIIESNELGISTYESINGFSPYLSSISFDQTTDGFKTALVANRRAFVGHVRRKDEIGKVVIHGDRVMYSEVGKFDTFPSTNFIDIGINDGDAFTALQNFADRILAFKENRLYIINISQGSPTAWFLESQHEGMGVFYPAATFKTDIGIIWANYSGVHFYDGARITTLTNKIESSYQSFYTTGTSVGYSPRKKQILVLKDATGGSAGDVYIYSFLTNSWIFADSLFTDSTPYTNFAIDHNQDLIVGYYASSYNYLQKWTDTAATNTGVSIRTKDMDFGYPSQKKNVYKALVSYKGDADQLNVKYHINGDTDTDSTFYLTNANGTSEGSTEDATPLLDSNTDDWIRAELVPFSATQAKGVYSFGLTMSGTAEADFQINDISVLYRMIRPLD